MTPSLNHGTHVAGIITRDKTKGQGIQGIADNVLIMPIVATTAAGDERDKDIANAIYYAVQNGARIINMSFSKKYSPQKSLVDAAIRYADAKNVLIVQAPAEVMVGDDNDTSSHFPVAIYEDGTTAKNFISVGWSRSIFNERLAHPHSNYGKRTVDLFAPGSDIFSTIPDNNYDFKSGSSMSAPIVAAIAGLLLSYYPSLSANQVKEIILKSAYKPEILVNRPGSNEKVLFSTLSISGGIVNAYNAVMMADAMTQKK